VEKGDGSYDSTEFISIHNAAFIAGTVQYTCTSTKAMARGLLDIPMGQQTYKRDTKAHRHFSNFYA
jgi:hypothetical protein